MADNQAPNPTSSTIPDPCHVPRWRLTGRRRLGAQLGMWHASSVGAHQRTWAWLRAVEQPLEVSWGPRYALWGDPWSYQACGARSAERSERLGAGCGTGPARHATNSEKECAERCKNEYCSQTDSRGYQACGGEIGWASWLAWGQLRHLKCRPAGRL